MIQTRLTGLFRLFRFELPFTAGACVVLGEILAFGGFPPASLLLLGFLSFFLISSTALILNDYFDYEIDKINSPERPLPSGRVTKRDVVLLSSAVALLGFAAGFMISRQALSVVFVVWLVGLLYNWRLKRTGFAGNFLVSVSVAMTFVFGGIVVGNPFDRVVWWFAVIAILIDLAEEIAADAMDIQGDRQAGSRSLAIIWGQQKALKLSGVLFLLVVVVSSIPFVLRWLDPVYLIPISLWDGVILYSTARLLNPRTRNQRQHIRWIYLGGLSTILTIILIRLLE